MYSNVYNNAIYFSYFCIYDFKTNVLPKNYGNQMKA